jgi:hypothetical protein
VIQHRACIEDACSRRVKRRETIERPGILYGALVETGVIVAVWLLLRPCQRALDRDPLGGRVAASPRHPSVLHPHRRLPPQSPIQPAVSESSRGNTSSAHVCAFSFRECVAVISNGFGPWSTEGWMMFAQPLARASRHPRAVALWVEGRPPPAPSGRRRAPCFVTESPRLAGVPLRNGQSGTRRAADMAALLV